MTLYQVLHELQIVLALILGACPLCTQPLTLARLAAALAEPNKYTRRLLHVLADRAHWQAALTEARRRAQDDDGDLPATGRAA